MAANCTIAQKVVIKVIVVYESGLIRAFLILRKGFL